MAYAFLFFGLYITTPEPDAAFLGRWKLTTPTEGLHGNCNLIVRGPFQTRWPHPRFYYTWTLYNNGEKQTTWVKRWGGMRFSHIDVGYMNIEGLSHVMNSFGGAYDLKGDTLTIIPGPYLGIRSMDTPDYFNSVWKRQH